MIDCEELPESFCPSYRIITVIDCEELPERYCPSYRIITVIDCKELPESYLLHRNSTVARRVTNDTSEHYGNP